MSRNSNYLRTSYSPDCEYIDGRVFERAVGEFDHARTQGEVHLALRLMEKQKGIQVVPEQRVQVRRDRFRVPDVCVRLHPVKPELVFTEPPFLVVEILSKDDTAGDLLERIADYREFGIPYVWAIDPRRKRGYIYTQSGQSEATDGVLRTSDPDIDVRLADVLAEQ